MSQAMTRDIRRGHTRFRTSLPWLTAFHSFSFGEHDDPGNTHHGLLLVNNDDRIRPETGFGTHTHHDMEIVTWVVAGCLTHTDSMGHTERLYPGLVQRMSAGSGISHSEMNPSATEDAHVIQMWIVPGENGVPPSYESRNFNAALDAGGLIPIASGRGHANALFLHQPKAVLWGGRLPPKATVPLPEAAYVHLFLAKGSAVIDGDEELASGDAVRLSHAGTHTVTATDPEGAEVLVWEMAANKGERHE